MSRIEVFLDRVATAFMATGGVFFVLVGVAYLAEFAHDYDPVYLFRGVLFVLGGMYFCGLGVRWRSLWGE